MEKIRPADSQSNVAEFSVSEISGALKRTVEDRFGHVRVRGEVSGYRGPHSSGHAYFALKDDRSRLEAVIWRGVFSKLKFLPQEGLEIIVTGKLTTYPGSSKYQIVIESVEPAGAGALMALLEERKKKLAAEGLFEDSRKKPIPFMPRVIGVVTSPTGAVIRDIIHRISDRFPVHVLVWPVRVQGETTGDEVSNAVAGFNALPEGGPLPRPDLVIVARGGGSLEDLWGFNDESVVRAVAASDIPVISAVGHETDWTLIDLVADRRAPTPTGAAEMAVPVKADLEASVARLSARLKGAVSREGDRKRQALQALSRALPSPDQLLALPRRRFDEAAGRLGRALTAATQRKRLTFNGVRLSPATLERRLSEVRRRTAASGERLPGVFLALVRAQRTRFDRDAARVSPTALRQRIVHWRDRLAQAERRADTQVAMQLKQGHASADQAMRLAKSLSHEGVLERGFALVRGPDDLPIKRARNIQPGLELQIQFADGTTRAVAASDGRKVAASSKKPKPSDKGPKDQGSLF
ncbi:exodeoxyribonuclease VII large subunit [Nitratireductor aquimarinus]|uniref:exodeoxyribonuclease VII large subunit n=1 Tax=Nitratireductor aquimarinus TaxID=889300 RepID=UPI002935FD10|nr:exodeoxyribonuclease VII large subunit [Nitratireductor aquimarinus]MDV2967261.1 exodeoxyribonuclease VII large subunit [Nitratireductor aquimarinus]